MWVGLSQRLDSDEESGRSHQHSLCSLAIRAWGTLLCLLPHHDALNLLSPWPEVEHSSLLPVCWKVQVIQRFSLGGNSVGLSFSPLFSPKTDPQFPLPFICFVLVLIFQWFSLFLEIQDLFLCMTPLTVYVTGYLSEGHSWAESANNFSAKPWKWYYTCSLCCAGDTWRVLSHFWWCWVKIIWMLC